MVKMNILLVALIMYLVCDESRSLSQLGRSGLCKNHYTFKKSTTSSIDYVSCMAVRGQTTQEGTHFFPF
jgi:hypothetical protein